jgi:quercetin dioxygenase-like cupin family protein
MSAFDHADTIRRQRIWDGVTSRAVHGREVTLALIELAPGACVPEHSHENEQVGVMIEGSATFRIGEEVGEVARGGTWCILAHVPHTVTAGPEGAVVAEVFAPPRHDWSSLETGEPGPGRWP